MISQEGNVKVEQTAVLCCQALGPIAIEDNIYQGSKSYWIHPQTLIWFDRDALG